jgi:hypothetical protein
MLRTKVSTLLVSLVLSSIIFAQTASAYSIRQAAAGPTEDLVALARPDQKDRPVAKADNLHKVRPIYKVRPQFISMMPPRWEISCLPVSRSKGWEVDAQVIFARIKGKIRMCTANWGGWTGLGTCGGVDQDLNGEWGIPDHGVVGSYSLGYRFRPNWAIRYSIMPMELNGSGGTGQNYWYGYGQGAQVKWQRVYQNIGLVYDPILTYQSRVGVFAGYTRLDEKLSFGGTNWFAWGTAPTFDHQLNMAMAGMEFEQALRTERFRNTLSLECRASVAFLDEAFGSDIMTGLRYTIPMGCGRSGYLGGGYRYVSFKKGYNDFKQIDTTLEGGYLKMALVF